MDTEINTDLVVRLKKDDISALGELYELLSKKIYNRCLFILKDQGLAEDATQEIFLKAFARVKTLKEDSKIEPWLNRMAYNHCIDKIRKIKKEKTVENQIETETELVDFLSELDEVNESEYYRKQLKAQIDLLSESERLILILYYWEGLQVSAIAEQLNLGESSVKMKLSRSRSKLKDQLAKKGVNHALEIGLLIILNLK